MASHTNVPSASSAPTFTGPMRGADVLIRVPHVGRQRRRLQRRELEIPVQHLVDRRGRPRVAPFVDLAGEAGIRHQGPPTIMIRTINPRAA